MSPPPGFVNDKVSLLENISSEKVDKNLLSTPQKIHDQKRLKSTSDGGVVSNNIPATPLEGGRQAQ